MTDKMKNILKIAVFGAGVLVLLLLFSLMMRPQKWFDEKLIQNRDSRYIQITEQKENTIDVLNIGDSLSLSVFSPLELWKQQGFTGFNIGADGLRLAESYHYLKNACKRQKPKVLMIESLYLFRYKLSDDSVMLLSQPIYYHVPFIKYHNIWKALVELPGVMIYHRGYTVNENSATYRGPENYMDQPIADNGRTEIPFFNRVWFDRIKKYCDAQGIKIIIYSAASASNYNWDRVHALEKFAADEGVGYIDLNEHIDEIGINWDDDSNDGGDHMNYFGCVKSTGFLGNYLRENADLQDHRGDAAYGDWDSEMAGYEQLVKDMDNMSFQDIHYIRESMIKQQMRLDKEKKK
jgi:hypothetical protein